MAHAKIWRRIGRLETLLVSQPVGGWFRSPLSILPEWKVASSVDHKTIRERIIHYIGHSEDSDLLRKLPEVRGGGVLVTDDDTFRLDIIVTVGAKPSLPSTDRATSHFASTEI